jgi:hypothetical protein
MKHNYWAPTLPSTTQQSGKLRLSQNAIFFTWLATLGKAPTADNLLKKNWLGTSTFLSLYWRGFF